MKRLLAILGTTAVMAAMTSCKNDNNQSAADAELQMQRYKDSIRMAADTAGLYEFQQSRAQNELAMDSQNLVQQNAPMAAAPARSTTHKSYSSAPHHSSTTRSRSYSGGSTGRSGSSGGSSGSTASSGTTAKKGMSKAAKGAIIGGAGGAVTGAVINKKNRAAGAVVGGIIGGAAGYGIGRHKDKKDGRY